MPPRQRPRNWLAARLRSAAGAVERLAGRVEPVGQPRQEPPSDPPRRFGEPPQHWLDVVASHAPGLLRDLELDTSPADAGRPRDDRPDGPGTDGAVPGPPDGSMRSSAVDRRGGWVGESSRPSTGSVGFPAVGTGFGDTAGTGSAQTGGRRGLSGGRGVLGTPDVFATADGTGIRGGPDPVTDDGAVDIPETVATPATAGLLGAAGVHGCAGVHASAGSPARAGFPPAAGADRTAGYPAPDGLHGTAGLPTTSGGHGTAGIGGVGRSDASDVHDASARSYGGDTSHPSGSGWSDASRSPRETAESIGAAGEPGGSPIGDPADAPGGRGTPHGHAGRPRPTRPGRLDSAYGRDTATSSPTPAPGAPGGVLAPSGRSLRQGSAPAAAPGDAGWDGRAAVEVDGSWPALPDERAWPDHRRADQYVGRSGGWRGSDIGTVGVSVGGAPRDRVGGRWPAGIEFPSTEIGSPAADPWPALPDDAAVWTVPGDGLDAAHLGRLDREQAGD
ncbi:hypothetical protein [Micromonospora sp. WMMC250]|uniref:hypothetical protein n=1 Tax=Micromonospora sp. WMMC250 TaxID=3014781 RepID=UPI0022B6E2D7|nr:hypothetical protein [Micromonospora sp. WMMC250]MCZ7374575.1 hypothetical protein [Micromonospora sp. WMMC250]